MGSRTGDYHVLVLRDQRWEVYGSGLSKERADHLARMVAVFSHGTEEPRIGRGAPPLENPPWTTRAVAKEWDTLEELVGTDLMPELSKPHASKRGELVAKIESLGCGAYGCVLPTNDPAVVLKITSDDSEVEFATKVLPRMSAPVKAGFVKYLHSAKLDSRHERHPLYALWRQSAQDVGKIGAAKGIADRMLGRERKSLLSLIAHSWGAAQVALLLLIEAGDDGGDLYAEALTVRGQPCPYKSSDDADDVVAEIEDIRDPSARLAAAIHHFVSSNRAMEGTSLARVGRALNAALAEGIFVADVHEGNLGRVKDDQRDLAWVVTDPGNSVVLPSPWR